MKRITLATAFTLAVGALIPGASASGAADPCVGRVNNTYKKLFECASLNGARAHQAALQSIANANSGIRTSGTSGYNASATYAADVLRAAGYNVTVQPFTFQTFVTLSPTVVEQVSPAGGVVSSNTMSYSGSGDVTARVSTVSAITGCDAADFAGFRSGDIALISRGACTFAQKASNAYAAGAAAVIVYNNAPGNVNGTLSDTFTLNIPVVSVSSEDGAGLVAQANGAGLTMRVRTDTLRGAATTSNVIAESKSGDPNNVVFAGAHLDSVNAGPGIEDNGTGTAAILEVAQAMAKVKPVNKVRFALWGAEESGLVGSTHYVEGLTQAERDKIALYLNFDMIGSPNHVFFVYDGDDSDAVGNGAGPQGSAAIESLFESFYLASGESYKGTDFSGRSDYGPFIAAGIPAGGLFTGAEGIKTEQEASIWGGTAGQQYDPCYHQACDTYDNINLHAFDVNVDAVAYSVLTYAFSTESVNGVKGQIVPGAPANKNSKAAGYPGHASDVGLHDHASVTR